MNKKNIGWPRNLYSGPGGGLYKGPGGGLYNGPGGGLYNGPDSNPYIRNIPPLNVFVKILEEKHFKEEASMIRSAIEQLGFHKLISRVLS